MTIDPERHSTAILDVEHMAIRMEVYISPLRHGPGGVYERTHYFSLEDKENGTSFELEMNDHELEEFARKIVMYRYAKRG